MITFRSTNLQDIEQIQQIEKEYYEGFMCPEDILKSWIKELPENFIVAEEDKKILGFIFFEYLNEIKTIPFVHKLEHKPNGKYVYISEVGISKRSDDSDILQRLFEKVIEKSKKDARRLIVWLTGSKSKHDKIETNILISNQFTKKENVKNWEAYPNFFVDDHYLWIKKI
jgi:N-acetylglutamate synthase-like GNAT family acetyltransferase